MSNYSKNSNVDWRWSALPIRVFGVDPIVVAMVPMLFVFGFDWIAIFAFLAVLGLAAYVAFSTKHGSILKWFRSIWLKKVSGTEWRLPRV